MLEHLLFLQLDEDGYHTNGPSLIHHIHFHFRGVTNINILSLLQPRSLDLPVLAEESNGLEHIHFLITTKVVCLYPFSSCFCYCL